MRPEQIKNGLPVDGRLSVKIQINLKRKEENIKDGSQQAIMQDTGLKEQMLLNLHITTLN